MPRPLPTILCLGLALGACARDASRPRVEAQAGPANRATDAPVVFSAAAPTDPTDPFEATNRRVLDFNWKMDDAVIKPVARTYRRVLGPWPRARIRNVLNNINEPTVAANRLLQGRPVAAATSLMRFLINSTLGLGGLFDLESIGGPPKQVADLGQTLAVWGVPDGPYLMLPFLGPSNPRELTGTIGNGFMNPISYPIPFSANIGRGMGQGLDEREQNIETIEEIRGGSLDVYARLRSLWQQHRDAELGRGTTTEPEVLDDPDAGDPPASPAATPARVDRAPVKAPPRQAVRARSKAKAVVSRGGRQPGAVMRRAGAPGSPGASGPQA